MAAELAAMEAQEHEQSSHGRVPSAEAASGSYAETSDAQACRRLAQPLNLLSELDGAPAKPADAAEPQSKSKRARRRTAKRRAKERAAEKKQARRAAAVAEAVPSEEHAGAAGSMVTVAGGELDANERVDALQSIEGRSRGRAFAGDPSKVHLYGLTISVDGRELLDAAELNLDSGATYGLVGRNGVGKTTLLRRMARHAIPGFPPGLRVVHVKQEAVGGDATPIKTVVDANTERTELLEREEYLLGRLSEEGDGMGEEEKQEVMHEVEGLASRLADIDADAAEAQAGKILRGLGFDDERLATPTRQLSGGWMMRVALACALSVKPHLLLLDEPTNHLDLPALLWLQEYLRQYESTVVIVSHDRAFLDAVCTHTIHFDHHTKKLVYYTGSFSSFVKARDARIAKRERMQAELDMRRARAQQTIDNLQQEAAKANKAGKGDRFKTGQIACRKTKLLRMGLDKTEDGKKFHQQTHSRREGSMAANAGGWQGRKMTAAAVTVPKDRELQFNLPPPADIDCSGDLLQLREVAFRYQAHGPPVLRDVTLNLQRGSKVVVVGANGSGKSTLVKVMTGLLEPTAGTVVRHPHLSVALFQQHHVNALEPTLTACEHLMQEFPGLKELEARKRLGAFGLIGDLAIQPMGTLSGGQRSRVVLTACTMRHPQLIILDEPTNHLDYASIEALVAALRGFPGAVLVITHDQFLMTAFAEETEGGQMWTVRGGEVARWERPVAAYVDQELDRVRRRMAVDSFAAAV